MSNVGEHVEQRELSYIVGGSAERQFLIKLNLYPPFDPTVLLFRYLPKRNENIHPQKDFDKNVYSSLFMRAFTLEINVCQQDGLNTFGVFI